MQEIAFPAGPIWVRGAHLTITTCSQTLVPEPDIQMRLQHPFIEYAVWLLATSRKQIEAAGQDQPS